MDEFKYNMSEIPLFPLPLVLFPGGRLPLKIFETRYLDMIKRCMRDNAGFGIVMIEEGSEIIDDHETQPEISSQGTYSTVVDFDQHSNGMLGIMTEGQAKFVIREIYEQSDHLLMAEVGFLEQEEESILPDHKVHLVRILQSLMKNEWVSRLNYEVDFNAAGEVGARLIELLPFGNKVKQQLFEMRNPITRLDELDRIITKMQ